MIISSYLLSPSKGMIEAGHIGHDGSLIRLWGVDDVCGVLKKKREHMNLKNKKSEMIKHQSIL